MNVPPTIAAETAILRQNVALSVIKQAAEQQKILVDILDQASRNAPLSASRGANVNFSV